MKRRDWQRFPVFTVVLVLLALALLALACEEEEEKVTPTPPVAETPEATPTVLKPGAAGIPSNPRDVRGLEGVLVLDDGLAIFKERPADEDRTGVTADSVKICVSQGLTGPLAAYTVPAMEQSEEMIRRINEAGGIHGRQIDYVVRDDQTNVAVAVDVWNELVQSEKCFASVGASQSATLAAVIDFLRANNVPIMNTQSGAQEFCEPTDRLTFCGTLPPYLLEGKAMAELALKEQPGAKIAAIYQNDPFGRSLLEGVKAAVPEGQLVAEIAYEYGTPDVTPLAYQADESGADYLLILATPPPAAIVKALRETVGSDLKVVVEFSPIQVRSFIQAAGSANWDGVAGFTPFTDPEATDPATTTYRAFLEEIGLGTSHIWQLGTWSIEMLVYALELAGPDLTREGLIEAMEAGFDGTWKCSLCLGPTVFGPQDHWALETLQAVRWSDAEQKYLPVGDPISYETSEGKGIRGNFPGYECSAETPCPWEEGS